MLTLEFAVHGVASAETVELLNGDKLEGVVILEQTEEIWVLEHPVLGRIEVPVSAIKPPEPEKPGLFGTSFLAGWDKALSAGFAGSSGVTDENNVNADLKFNQETTAHRDAFAAVYTLAEASGDRTKNSVSVSHQHDFLFSGSKWFAFLAGDYTWDEFQVWDHRILGAGGAGYDFLRTEKYTFSGRIGPGFTVTRGGEDDREDFNGLAGLNGKWAIREGLDFTAGATYYPALNDLPQYLAVGIAELKIAIGVIEGLGFKVGGQYAYDSQDKDHNDRTYYGNLVYDF